MQIVYCALGAFVVVELIKAGTPTPPRPWVKLVLVLAGSLGVALLLLLPHHHRDVAALAVLMLAGAGLAVAVHRLARLARVGGDWLIRDIIRKRPH